jgi:hypothetical protein
LVGLSILAAAFIPEFLYVISLIGSASNSFAGFILPQIYFLRICGWRYATRLEIIANIAIIVFGLFGGGISTVVAMKDIIQVLHKRYGS